MARTSTFASVLEQIDFGIQAVASGQIIPPDGASERKSHQEPLLVCDDYLKRVYTYREILSADMKPLMEEGKKLKREVVEACMSGRKEPREIKTLGDLIGSAFSFGARKPGPDEEIKIARVKEIENQLLLFFPLVELVSNLFWAEVRHRAPEGADVSNLVLCADWSVIKKTDAEEVADLLDELSGKLRSGEAAAA